MFRDAIHLTALCVIVAFGGQSCVSAEVDASQGQTSANEKSMPKPTMNFTTHQWTSNDGAAFPFRRWLPSSPESIKAIIIGVHGLNGSARDFSGLAEKATAKKIAVYSYEMRGQGNDPEKSRIGDITPARAWTTDLAVFTTLVRNAHPDTPVYIYGESLGSLVTTFTVQDDRLFPVKPAGVILSSPVVTLNGKLSLPKRIALQLAAVFVPRYRLGFAGLSPEPVDNLQVTSYATVTESAGTTPYLVEKFSLRFFSVVGQMIEQMMTKAATFSEPVLVLYGGKDVVTDSSEVERFIGKIPPALASKHFYPEGHHLLLYDTVNEQVFTDTCAWITDQLTTSEETELRDR